MQNLSVLLKYLIVKMKEKNTFQFEHLLLLLLLSLAEKFEYTQHTNAKYFPS